jgi:flavin-dependent dehydrogenase
LRLENQGRLIPGGYEIKYGGIPLKPLRRTFGRRVLVVGDAAGQVKPTTGGGIYFGLICAEAAARTLHNALLVNDLSASKLSGYQKEWQRKLGKELRTEYWIRRIYEHLKDDQINKIFSGIKSSQIADSLLKSDDVSFDMHGALLFKALKSGVWAEAKRLLRMG